MPEELSPTQQQPHESRIPEGEQVPYGAGTNHESRKKALPWIVAFVIILAAAGFWLANKESTPSFEDRIEEFFTLDKIVRTDIPEAKLREYQQRLAVAKADSTSPDGDINFRSYMEAGSVKKGVGDYEGARDVWEYMNEKRPKNSVSFANLGDLYANFLKDPQKSEANYLEAIENDPSDPAYMRNLLELYEYRIPNKLGFSEHVFKGAADKNPGKADFWILLARYYELSKDYGKAVGAWERVAEIDPDQKSLVDNEIKRLEGMMK